MLCSSLDHPDFTYWLRHSFMSAYALVWGGGKAPATSKLNDPEKLAGQLADIILTELCYCAINKPLVVFRAKSKEMMRVG